MKTATGKSHLDDLRERRSKLASAARARRKRSLYGQRIATSFAPVVGRDIGLSDFDMDVEPPVKFDLGRPIKELSERAILSLTEDRLDEIARSLEERFTSFEGWVGLYASHYLGLCKVERVSIRGMVRASEAVEDAVVFYPREVRGAIVIDCYKSPPGHPPFSLYIMGDELAESLADFL